MSDNGKDKNSGWFLAVTLALIGLLGTLGASLISNWDKVFPSTSQPSPLSSPTTTLPPSTTPSSPPTIASPPSSSLPTQSPSAPPHHIVEQQTWEGIFSQNNYGNYQMILHIEQVAGKTFQGKLHWVTLRQGIYFSSEQASQPDGKFDIELKR